MVDGLNFNYKKSSNLVDKKVEIAFGYVFAFTH